MLRRCLRPLIPQIGPCLQANNVLDKSKRTQCPLPLPGCKRSTAQAFQYFKFRYQFRSANQRKERNHLVRNGRHLVHICRMSTAFCKRSALRRVSVTKLSIMDFAASGSSPEKAVSAEKS